MDTSHKMPWKKQMAEEAVLMDLIQAFDVPKLQTLLVYVGQSINGSKAELKRRAMDLLRLRWPQFNTKIKELYELHIAEIEMDLPSTSGVQMGRPSAAQHCFERYNNLPKLSPAPAPPLLPPPPPPPPLRAITPRERNPLPIPGQELMCPPLLRLGCYPPEVPIQPHEMASFPLRPEVRMSDLGFYDVVSHLLKPSTLVRKTSDKFQEQVYMFQLTQQQLEDLLRSRTACYQGESSNPLQVQLRFCNLDTDTNYDDDFPPSLVIKVNSHLCPFMNFFPTKPGVEPKQVPCPLDITPFLKFTAILFNFISIAWNAEYGGTYAVAVNIVRKLSAGELVERLSHREPISPYITIENIQRILSEDGCSDIAPTSHKVSMYCPISKARMILPCRGNRCTHLQCFDGVYYILMNEQRPMWQCPLCNRSARFNSLVVDGYFLNILSSGKLKEDYQDIQLYADGSWSVIMPRSSEEITLEEPDTSSEMREQNIQPQWSLGYRRPSLRKWVPQQGAQGVDMTEEPASDSSSEMDEDDDEDIDYEGNMVEFSKKLESHYELIDLTQSDTEDDQEAPSQEQYYRH